MYTGSSSIVLVAASSSRVGDIGCCIPGPR